MIIMGVLITVVSIVAGILGNQINLVQGELSENRDYIYAIPSLKEDIIEIKTDIANIEDKIDIIISRP